MTLRVLHTSDWHLGHTLHDVSRAEEHDHFLSWLLDTLEEQNADALLVSGDIFDVANPSAAAQKQWYRFLSEAHCRMPQLEIVVIAGNHDSASRLEAPQPLLEFQNITAIGWLPRKECGAIDLDRLLVALHDSSGEVAAVCAAVPFLRPADLPKATEVDDVLIDGVRQVYSEAIAGAVAMREEGQAILAMGHCYMSSSKISDLSERKILGGNEHALPADIFSEEVSYAALGHLHLAQEVAGRQGLRYSGSPIPLSMSEIKYPHQVCLVTFEGEDLVDVEVCLVPRSVELLRIPENGPAEKADVLSELALLPGAHEDAVLPLLEVRIRIERPESALRGEVTDALDGKHARLVKLTVETTGSGQSLSDSAPKKQLHDLHPEDVFRQLYASEHEGELPDELMTCFHEILEQVEQGEEQ